MNAPSRIREFRHLFASHRRITAAMRISLDTLRYVLGRPNLMLCHRVEWEGSKVKQPSVELYPEFKLWADSVFSSVASTAGISLSFLFEPPEHTKRLEFWLYEPGKEPRLAKILRKPDGKARSETVAGLPPKNWEGNP